jgi:hypothetical protein
VEEVRAYCQERGNSVDAQRFVDYYGANGWKVGKNPMKDWKAAVRTWENNGYDTGKRKQKYMTAAEYEAAHNSPEEQAQRQKDMERLKRVLAEGKI